jgi:hypothetical protein
MEQTVDITIPAEWLEGLKLDEDDLRTALRIGLEELRRRQAVVETDDPVLKALLSTGLVSRLTVPKPEGIEPATERRPPIKLPGPPVSEILIAQRKRVSDELGGELHDRVTRGESLSAEERELLDAWYLLLDRDDKERLGLATTETDEETG